MNEVQFSDRDWEELKAKEIVVTEADYVYLTMLRNAQQWNLQYATALIALVEQVAEVLNHTASLQSSSPTLRTMAGEKLESWRQKNRHWGNDDIVKSAKTLARHASQRQGLFTSVNHIIKPEDSA